MRYADPAAVPATGSNLAATQQQIADLFVSDFRLTSRRPHVEFIRSKTRNSHGGTLAHYELWPETVTLIRKRIRRNASPESYALLTKDGNRMVYFNAKGGRCDPIFMGWKKLTLKANLSPERRLSFKHLRKTAADMVLRLADECTQQQMLAHAAKSMAARHYTGKPDFKRLTATLRRVRREVLWEMFELPAPKQKRFH